MKKNVQMNMWHATLDNKKTLCGIKIQLPDAAATINFFKEFMKDKSYNRYCCKNCDNIIKKNNL